MASYLITGSSRGLGLELATQLSSLPSSQIGTIFATGRSESPAVSALLSKSSGRVVFVKLDAESKESIANAVGFTVIAVSPASHRPRGSSADLSVEQGTRATLDKIFSAGKEHNGEFKNIIVKAWEKVEGPNQYDGINPPW